MRHEAKKRSQFTKSKAENQQQTKLPNEKNRFIIVFNEAWSAPSNTICLTKPHAVVLFL